MVCNKNGCSGTCSIELKKGVTGVSLRSKSLPETLSIYIQINSNSELGGSVGGRGSSSSRQIRASIQVVLSAHPTLFSYFLFVGKHFVN